MSTSIKVVGLVLFSLFFMASCATTLKPYERVYINDPEMQLSVGADVKFGYYQHSIREGAVEAKGQKGGGGCGCN